MTKYQLAMMVLVLVKDPDIPDNKIDVVAKAKQCEFSLKNKAGDVVIDGAAVRAMLGSTEKEAPTNTLPGSLIGQTISVDYKDETVKGPITDVKFSVKGCGTKLFKIDDIK